MMREVKIWLDDNERFCVVSKEFVDDFADWKGPYDLRVVEDEIREEECVTVELKRTGNLKRVEK